MELLMSKSPQNRKVRVAGALVLALVSLASEPPAQAQSTDNCAAIRFARGTTSTKVTGSVAPGDSLQCYNLTVGEGQPASVRVEGAVDVAFSMTHSRNGHETSAVDATDMLDFTTRAGVYTIRVFRLRPAPQSTPFTLSVAVGAAGVGPGNRAEPGRPGPPGVAPIGAAPAGAEGQIRAWARRVYGANLVEPISMFFGDFTGDGVPDALVFAYAETGGSAVDLKVALFRNLQGRMVYWREHNEVRGFEPRDVRFSQGAVTVTTKVLRAGDARCCPTGSRTWMINAQ
jgi:hypothetical protein